MIFTYFICKKYKLDYSVTYNFLVLSQMACCIGHMFPCFFQFRGGKGILTTWSCTFLMGWKIAVILIFVFLFSLILSRIVSLSSILCAISYPILMLIFTYVHDINLVPFFISLVVSALIFFKHVENIVRIIKRIEPKISLKR